MRTLPMTIAAMVLAISGVASADTGLRCVNVAHSPVAFSMTLGSKSVAIRFGKFETEGDAKSLSGRSLTALFYEAQGGYTKYMGRVRDLYDSQMGQRVVVWYRSDDISNPRVRVLMSVANSSAMQEGGATEEMYEMSCSRQD